MPHLSPTTLTTDEQRLIIGLGHDPITERTLRPIVAEPECVRQRSVGGLSVPAVSLDRVPRRPLPSTGIVLPSP